MTLSNLDWEIKKIGVGCSIFSLKSKLSVTSGGYLRVKNSFQSCFQNPSWPGRKIEKQKFWIEWRRRILEDVFKFFFEFFFKHEKIQTWCVFRIFFVKKKWTFIHWSTQSKIYFAASQRAYGSAMAKDRVAKISTSWKLWIINYDPCHNFDIDMELSDFTLFKWCQAIK